MLFPGVFAGQKVAKSLVVIPCCAGRTINILVSGIMLFPVALIGRRMSVTLVERCGVKLVHPFVYKGKGAQAYKFGLMHGQV